MTSGPKTVAVSSLGLSGIVALIVALTPIVNHAMDVFGRKQIAYLPQESHDSGRVRAEMVDTADGVRPHIEPR